METAMIDHDMKINTNRTNSINLAKNENNQNAEVPITDIIVERAQELKADTIETYNSSIHAIRKNPITSIVIAAGVGIIIGMIFKKRK